MFRRWFGLGVMACGLTGGFSGFGAESFVQQGDQALRSGDLAAAHAAYGQALVEQPADPDGSVMRAATVLADLFERPTTGMQGVLDSFDVSYVKDLYAADHQGTALNEEPYTDSNSNGEYDEGEWFDDWNWNGVKDEGEWYWDENYNGVYDGPEPFTDTNGNGVWDDDLIPAGASSVNTILDVLNTDLVGRIDEALALLGNVGAAGNSWTRTITADMLPGFESLVDENTATTINKTDVLFVEAGLNLVKSLVAFVDGYDLDVTYADVTADTFDLTQQYWDGHSAFFTVHNTQAFATAKGAFRSFLQKMVAGSDSIVSGTIPGRSAGVTAGLGNEYWGWNQVKEGAEKLLSSLDGATDVSMEDVDPILMNLGKLFDAPLDRRILAAHDFDLGETDWDAVADPTLNGLFPGKTMAEWYKFHTFNLYDDMNAFTQLKNGVPYVLWNAERGYGNYWDSTTNTWQWGPHWVQQNDYRFEDKMRFDLYRGTSFVATRYPGEYPIGSFWWLENDTTPTSDLYYKVKVTFSDGANQAVVELPRAYVDSDGDRLPDYWEEQYGLDKFNSDEWNDNDQDGARNFAEFLAGSDPTKADTDGDGMTDGYEVDRDGLIYYAEECMLDPTDPSDASGDLDMDGYTNLAEFKAGTDVDDFSDNPATAFSWEGVSVNSEGEFANAEARLMQDGMDYNVRIETVSDDGNRIFFKTAASNLDLRADGMKENLYVRDCRTGQTKAINVGHDGTNDTLSNSSMADAFITATPDGRWVVFVSDSNNLVPAVSDNPEFLGYHLYVRDLDNGMTTLITPDPVEEWASKQAGNVLLTADGRFVTFVKMDSQSGMQQVYRYDREVGGSIVPVCVSHDSEPLMHGSYLVNDAAMGGDVYARSRMSQDGRYVFFSSYADNLVPGDTNGTTDLFVRDMVEETTQRVNLGVDGRQKSGMGMYDRFVRVSEDGRFVVFTSDDSGLAGDAWQGDPMQQMFNGLFVRDIVEQKTTFVASLYDTYMAGSSVVLVTPDARFVAYAKSIDAGNAVYTSVIYVYDRINGTTVLATPSMAGGIPSKSCTFAASDGVSMYDWNGLGSCLSEDGRYLFFRSEGDDLVPGDTNGSDMYGGPADIFVRDLLHGVTKRVNLSDSSEQSFPNTMTLYGGDRFVQASADGHMVYFMATDHLAGPEPEYWDWEYWNRIKLYRRDIVKATTTRVLASYLDASMGTSTRGFMSASGDFGVFKINDYDWYNGIDQGGLYKVGDSDTDGDGITDRTERWFGLNPHFSGDASLDSDGDGLANADECRVGSDPYDGDTDGDGLPDGWEVTEGVDPLLDDAQRDPDGDGQSNQDEFLAGLHPRIFEKVDFLVLHHGWNMVSIPSGVKAPTVAGVFQGRNLGPVWAWDGFNQVYVDAGEGDGTLSDKAGYWIYMGQEDVIVFEKE